MKTVDQVGSMWGGKSLAAREMDTLFIDMDIAGLIATLYLTAVSSDIIAATFVFVKHCTQREGNIRAQPDESISELPHRLTASWLCVRSTPRKANCSELGCQTSARCFKRA